MASETRSSTFIPLVWLTIPSSSYWTGINYNPAKGNEHIPVFRDYIANPDSDSPSTETDWEVVQITKENGEEKTSDTENHEDFILLDSKGDPIPKKEKAQENASVTPKKTAFEEWFDKIDINQLKAFNEKYKDIKIE